MATPSMDSCWGKEEGCGAFQKERGHDAGPHIYHNATPLAAL